MWDLWWTKWRWGRFSPNTSVPPANLHFTNFSQSPSPIIRGWYNRAIVAAVPKVPPYKLKKKKPLELWRGPSLELYLLMSRDSVVSIATSYGLDKRGVGVRVPVGLRFSLLHVVQTGSGVHPTYLICPGQENMDRYIHSLICLVCIRGRP
jgi:hypothetical protein